MFPVYHEPGFTFRFADDRVIPRFHLAGVAPGRRVVVYAVDPRTRGPADRAGVLAEATAGDGGWVDLPSPIRVRAGDVFVAVVGDPA